MSTTTAKSTKSTNDLQEKANSFAKSYLRHFGVEVIEEDYKCKAGTIPFIISGNGLLGFIEAVTINKADGGFPDVPVLPKSREAYEQIAATFLSGYDGSSVQVRFDVISIIVVDKNEASLKYYGDVFDCCN